MSRFKAIRCPNCQAPLKLNGGGRVQTITCQYCKSVIDLNNKERVLADFRGVEPPESPFKIGMEGRVFGVTWRIIGLIIYRDRDGEEWSEFLLFNPYYGYSWLVDEGSDNFFFSRRVRDIDLRIWVREPSPPRAIKYRGNKFLQDDYPYAVFVKYVEGELTWVAKQGDRDYCWDYISSDGEVVNIERSKIEVESYYSKKLKSSTVRDAFDYPKEDSSRSSFADRRETLSANSEEVEESAPVASNRTLMIFMIIFVLDILFLLKLESMHKVAFDRDIVGGNSTLLVDRFRVGASDTLTKIDILLLGDRRGFDSIDINISKFGEVKPTFKIENGTAFYPKNPALAQNRIPKNAKSVEAKLILDKGFYEIAVERRDPKVGVKIVITTGESDEEFLFFAFMIFFIFHWWILSRYRYEQEKIPKWFMFGGVAGGVLIAYIAFSLFIFGLTLVFVFITFSRYLSDGDEEDEDD